MTEKTIIITERDGGQYEIQNDGISDFGLIGILECIVFDLKTARQKGQTSLSKQPEDPAIKKADFESEPETAKESPKLSEKIVAKQKAPAPVSTAPSSPDLRTRIVNATKAIKDLGGKIDDTDLSNLTDEELQLELAELTNQYKRLKNSKAAK